MAITTYDGLVSALAAGTKLDFYKVSATAEGAATWHSLLNVGSIPVVGSTPAPLSGVVCNDATSGAFTGITFSNTTYLMQAVASGSTAGKLIIYDRLWHNGGLTGTNTVSVQICTTKDITRPNSTGTGVEMWGEIYAPIGATARTLNVEYQNQAGVSARIATYAHPANAESVGQMFPLTLVSTDTGVQIVRKQYWLAGSTGAGGNWGIVLMRRLAEIPITNINTAYSMDFAELGMPTVYSSACVALMVLCTTTNTGIIQGSMRLGNG